MQPLVLRYGGVARRSAPRDSHLYRSIVMELCARILEALAFSPGLGVTWIVLHETCGSKQTSTRSTKEGILVAFFVSSRDRRRK